MAQLVKTVQGLAIASVKTVEGLAIASAKTIMGVDNTGGGGACTTEQIAVGGTFDGNADWSFYTELSTQFTTVGGFTCCKISANLFAFGTVAAGTLQAAIYTDSGSGPGTLVGTPSATIDRTTIGSLSYVEFTGVSAVLSGATNYYIKITASANDTNSSNCIGWEQDDGTGKSSYGFRAGWGTDLLANRSYSSKTYST